MVAYRRRKAAEWWQPVRLPGVGLLLYVRVVAGFAPCRVAIPMG